jgi:hypothetical protein
MSANLNLDHVHVTLQGGVDLDLDQIADALKTGVNANVGATVGLTANIDAGLGNVRAHIDAGLNDIRITTLAPVQVGITQLPVINTVSQLNAKIDAGLDNIRITELPPIKLEFSFKPIRIHLPLNYHFSIELFGIHFFKFSICGEGMAITEDYAPHETERCR